MMPSIPTLFSVAQVLHVSPDRSIGWAALASTDRSAEFQRVMGLFERAHEAEPKRARSALRREGQPTPNGHGRARALGFSRRGRRTPRRGEGLRARAATWRFRWAV